MTGLFLLVSVLAIVLVITIARRRSYQRAGHPTLRRGQRLGQAYRQVNHRMIARRGRRATGSEPDSVSLRMDEWQRTSRTHEAAHSTSSSPSGVMSRQIRLVTR
jgi:hypothetical protein